MAAGASPTVAGAMTSRESDTLIETRDGPMLESGPSTKLSTKYNAAMIAERESSLEPIELWAEGRLKRLALKLVACRVVKMRVRLVACDSMGVRSMCTRVEADGVVLVIDPSAALAPRRYGLPPHRLEWERLDEAWREIERACSDADVMVVTHYHLDHYSPRRTYLYEGKIVLLKSPEENVNFSQRRRGLFFTSELKNIAREIRYVDGAKLKFDATTIEFSPPVPHGGEGTKLGYVIMVKVSESKGDTMVFTSDISGPVYRPATEWIVKAKPKLVILDGPPIYHERSEESLAEAVENMAQILGESSVEKLVLDHHALRDLSYREKLAPVFQAGEKLSKAVLTAAEYMGVEEKLLEASRLYLYAREGAELSSIVT